MEDPSEKSSSTESDSNSSGDSYEASPPKHQQPHEESLTRVPSAGFVTGSIPPSLSLKSGHLREAEDDDDDTAVIGEPPQHEPVLPKRAVYESGDALAVEQPADVILSDEAEDNSDTLSAKSEKQHQDGQQAGGATLELNEDSSKAEEEEEVKSEPKGTSVGNGSAQDEPTVDDGFKRLTRVDRGEMESSEPAPVDKGEMESSESAPVDKEEMESPEPAPVDRGEMEPHESAPSDRGEMESPHEPASGDRGEMDNTIISYTTTKKLRFEVDSTKHFTRSARKTWRRSWKKFLSSNCTAELYMCIDPDIVRDNEHTSEFIAELTLTDRDPNLSYRTIVQTRLLDPTRDTCLGHDEQMCSVKDDHEPIAVKLHLAPQDAIKECTGARKLILLVSVTVQSGPKVVLREDGDWTRLDYNAIN